jgi:hypothetical protein
MVEPLLTSDTSYYTCQRRKTFIKKFFSGYSPYFVFRTYRSPVKRSSSLWSVGMADRMLG